MFPLVISVSCAHLISQYLLIYLVLCNLLMLGLRLTQPACLMRYMYKSIFLLGPVPFCSASQAPLLSGVAHFPEEKRQLTANAVPCVWSPPAGLNGAVNGSAACPPTTQSGSFPITPPPVQVANKASKNSEPSNSHLTSTQHNPAEVAEKPTLKNKEKVSSENPRQPLQYGLV